MREDLNAENSHSIARAAGRRFAVIGGGTGLSTLLLGLKEYTDNITAVVTVSDDGGSSGIIRREYGTLPPGDIRNCLLALANTSPIMEQLLGYRFTDGSLAGQSFGNLFILALSKITGSFESAVLKMNQILAVTGRVLPVCKDSIALKATFEDGSTVVGETAITGAKMSSGLNIHRVELLPPDAAPLPEALEAIHEADVIVLGPGSLYTSIIPNLLVPGISQAIAKSGAIKLYVLNIMTQFGETEGYSALDHAMAVLDHAGAVTIDACVYNTRIAAKSLLERYAQERSQPIYPGEEGFSRLGIELFGYDMLSRDGRLARHDPLRLAFGIMDACRRIAPRSGRLGELDSLLLSEE